MRFSSASIIGHTRALLASILCISSAALGQSKTAQAPLPGAPRNVIAFVDVSVVPMDEERVLTGQTVLVQGGWITALGPTSRVTVPAGATKIDGHGKFLIPGLADMHAHVAPGLPHIGNVPKHWNDRWIPLPVEGYADTSVIGSPEDRLFLWLTNGATTIRDVDLVEDMSQDASMDKNETWGKQALKLRALAASGQAWIPHMYVSAQWGPRSYIGHKENAADTVRHLAMDSIAHFIAAYKAKGYDFVKLHDESLPVIDSVMVAAKRLGIPVIGHVPNGTVEHALTGYKSIEHPVIDYAWNEAAGLGVLAAAMRRADVYNCPTQSHYNNLHYAVWDPSKFLNLKVLQDSGVKLLIGTDELPRTGLIARELQEFVVSGLTPYQALQAGTVNVARYFGTSDQSGTLTVGKRADMVLLAGNPLQEIRYTAQPAGVMLSGRWLSRAEMDRRMKGITFPTFTPGEGLDRLPLKSYWGNVVDEFVTTATPVFGYKFMWAGIQEIGNRYTSETLPPGFKRIRTDMNKAFGEGYQNATLTPVQLQLRATFADQRRALIDSLGTSDQYAAGTRRVVQLIAQQLGTFRAALPEGQRSEFDQKAKAWLERRQVKGNTATIPGVN